MQPLTNTPRCQDVDIRHGGLASDAVQALLRQHLDDMQLHSPPEDIHALDLHGLQGPGIDFWAAWRGDELLGCCALHELDPAHAEIKSMRTAPAHRGTGVAKRMMEHLLAVAARRGYARLSLETGSAQAFAPARSLYARFGFAACGPFAQYVDSPHSVFMTKALAGPHPDRLVPEPGAPRARSPLSPLDIARSLSELWSPRVIAELDDSYIKVAKVQGTLAWHRHADEDELFFVLEGRFRLEFEDGVVELGPGELHVVPRGVLHNPVAERECLLMLVERKSTRHTGDVVTTQTRALEEQLRPIVAVASPAD